MNESIIEDLMPFIVMIAGMIVMAIIGIIYTFRRGLVYREHRAGDIVQRGEDASVGVGSTFQG